MIHLILINNVTRETLLINLSHLKLELSMSPLFDKPVSGSDVRLNYALIGTYLVQGYTFVDFKLNKSREFFFKDPRKNLS
jgi:hypothetical protein